MTSVLRIGVAGVVHETNTFAPGVTGLADFRWEEDRRFTRERFEEMYAGTKTSMGGVIDAARRLGIELVPGIYADATPSGIVSREAAEEIMDALVSSVEDGLDGLIVILHGAMAAEGYEDMEGEILNRLRLRLGRDLPVAITLDLHGNISDQMIAHSDVVIGYDTYPHVDIYERAVEAFERLVQYIRGEISPTHAIARPKLLVAPEAMLTEKGFFREIMEKAFEMERLPGVLNVLVAGGFPFSDVPDAGVSVVVTTDGDPALARRCADELCRFISDHREELKVNGVPPEQALALALEQEEGPVILVEGSDNVGGGAPGDATHVLQHLVAFPKKSLIVFCDAEAAREAHRLGVGETGKFSVGGKSDRLHGSPVDIEGRVRLLSDGRYKHIGPYMTGKEANMGRTAVVEAGPLTLVLTERKNAPWDLGHLSILGLHPADFHVIVVKSALAWKTAFQPFAKAEILVDSPGCCSFNLHHFQYRKAVAHGV